MARYVPFNQGTIPQGMRRAEKTAMNVVSRDDKHARTALTRVVFPLTSRVAEGVTSPWNFPGPLSSLLLVLFVVDARLSWYARV